MLKKFCDYHNLHRYRLEEVITHHPLGIYLWDKHKLASNRAITEAMLDACNRYLWDMEKVSANSSVPLSFIVQHPHWRWCYPYLSKNESMTVKYINDNPNENWSDRNIVANAAFTVYSLMKIKRLEGKLFNYIDNLSENRSLHMQFVEDNIEAGWNVDALSGNTALTVWFVRKYIYWPWNMKKLSANTSMTTEFIEAHPEMRWDIGALSGNSIIDVKFVLKHSDWDWDPKALLGNYNVGPICLIELPHFAPYIELICKFSASYVLSINNTASNMPVEKLLECSLMCLLPREFMTVEYVLEHEDEAWVKAMLYSCELDDFKGCFYDLPFTKKEFRDELSEVSNMMDLRPPTLNKYGRVMPGREGGREYQEVARNTLYGKKVISEESLVCV